MAAMSTDPPRSERDILRRAVELISDRIPATWTSQAREEVTLVGRRRADAVLALRAPDGSQANVVIEAKRVVETRDVSDIARELGRLRELASEDGQPAGALLAAPYLNPAARVRLAENGIGYADATGNLLLQLDRPALFLRDVGTDKDPWRGPGRPRGSFKGGTAARVFRAFVDFSPPRTVPQLVERSGASTGVSYRVVDFLEREDMLKRAPRSGIIEVDWRQLIERWSQQYGFAPSSDDGVSRTPRPWRRAGSAARRRSPIRADGVDCSRLLRALRAHESNPDVRHIGRRGCEPSQIAPRIHRSKRPRGRSRGSRRLRAHTTIRRPDDRGTEPGCCGPPRRSRQGTGGSAGPARVDGGQ